MQKCTVRNSEEGGNCLLCFCCRTAEPSCLNRKMTLALGLCVLSNWNTNTPWAQQQICIKVMNQSHFASCQLPGTGSIVAVSGVTAQSQASAHIADLLSVCEVVIGGRGGGWRVDSSAVCHNAISHWSGWKKQTTIMRRGWVFPRPVDVCPTHLFFHLLFLSNLRIYEKKRKKHHRHHFLLLDLLAFCPHNTGKAHRLHKAQPWILKWQFHDIKTSCGHFFFSSSSLNSAQAPADTHWQDTW